MKKIGIFCTNYSLMLYILWNRDWRDTHFFIYGLSSDLFDKMKQCGAQYVSGTGFFWINRYIHHPWEVHKRLLRRAFYLYDKYCIVKPLARKAKQENIPVYAQDHIDISFLFHNDNFNVIEDGLLNYRSYEDLKEVFSRVWKTEDVKYVPGGWDSSVKNVYLTGRLPVPEGLRSKAVINPLIESWNRLPSSEQKMMCQLFSVPESELRELISSGRTMYFLTSNYCPTLCSPEDWLKICQEILGKYDHQHMVIRPHPRDTFDYEKYFPDCYVLRGKFPFEFVAFLQLPVEKIISIRCTAIFGIWDDSKIDEYPEYETQIREKLQKH